MTKHNGKTYEYYSVPIGCSVEDTLLTLIKESLRTKQLLYTRFNIYEIYSDEDSLDSAYQKCVGVSWVECKTKQEKAELRRQEELKKFLNSIPKIKEGYLANGHDILDKKYWDLYEKMLDESLYGMYQGWDLTQALEIIEMLNNNCSLKDAVVKFDKQGHSGFSHGLVRAEIQDLCDRGAVFFEATI